MIVAFLKWNPFHHKICERNYDFGGEYNGYVAFDKELPDSWQGKASFDDNNTLDHLVNVHGGITYDNIMESWIDEPIIPLTALPKPEVFKTFRCIGFDTLHTGDYLEDWPIERVKEETFKLMKQIEQL